MAIFVQYGSKVRGGAIQLTETADSAFHVYHWTWMIMALLPTPKVSAGQIKGTMCDIQCTWEPTQLLSSLWVSHSYPFVHAFIQFPFALFTTLALFINLCNPLWDARRLTLHHWCSSPLYIIHAVSLTRKDEQIPLEDLIFLICRKSAWDQKQDSRQNNSLVCLFVMSIKALIPRWSIVIAFASLWQMDTPAKIKGSSL